MAGTRMRVIATIPAVAMLWLGASACSVSGSVGTNNLDVKKAEDEIAKGIQEQLEVTVTVKCPETVPIQQGGTFSCTVTDPNGETATVSVTQTDDKGTINWKLVGEESASPAAS